MTASSGKRAESTALRIERIKTELAQLDTDTVNQTAIHIFFGPPPPPPRTHTHTRPLTVCALRLMSDTMHDLNLCVYACAFLDVPCFRSHGTATHSK